LFLTTGRLSLCFIFNFVSFVCDFRFVLRLIRRALNAQPLNDYDPEIERTFRQRLREQREAINRTTGDENQALQEARMAELQAELEATRARLVATQNQLAHNQDPSPQTLAEYKRPTQYGPISGVVYPEVQARHFELKPSLINMVQQNQFGGLPSKNPH
jgi:ribosomal protein L29